MTDGQDKLLENELIAAKPVDDELDRIGVRANVMRLFDMPAQAPTVGRFEILHRLGAGGMGVVYLAHDPDLGREVALKLVQVKAGAARTDALAEAQALAKLSHPNVVAVHDVGVVGDCVYLVMEFVRGRTLREYAADEERTRDDIVRVYRQAGEGLSAAHRAGLIHRDFKPDNAVVDEADGRVRVIDFGLAHEDDGELVPTTAGTPGYIAPEHRAGEPISPAADQYAFAVALGEALSIRGAVPGWIQSIVARATEAEPSDRFDDLDSLVDALGRDPALTRRRRLAYAAVAVVVLGAFAGGALLFAGDDDVCTGAEQSVEKVWPGAERARDIERLAAIGPYGASVAPRLAAGWTDFAARWASQHRSICLARERREHSDELHDRQMVCLDRQLRALPALRHAVDGAQAADALADLVEAVRALPVPERCADIGALTAVAPPDPAIADDVIAVEQELEALRMTLAAGEFDAAHRTADAMVERVRSLGYEPTTAQLELLRGRALLDMAKLPQAIAPLREATTRAMTAGAHDLAIEAWARRAWVQGNSGDAAAALAGLDVIDALAAREGADPFAAGLLHNNVGSVHIARGDRAAARDALAKAVAISDRISGPGALELAGARANLAIVTDDATARVELAEQSVARLAALVGRDHPRTLIAIRGQAMVMPSAADAVGVFAPACQSLATLHPTLQLDIAVCHFELGWAALVAGDDGRAAVAMTKAAGFDVEFAPLARGLGALLAGEAETGVRLLAPLLDNAAIDDASAWWRQLRRAEIEMALARARVMSGDSAAAAGLRAAEQRLAAIGNPAPVVERRLAVVRAWLR